MTKTDLPSLPSTPAEANDVRGSELRSTGGFGSETFADRYFCPSCRHDFDACDSVFALPTGPAVECEESTPGRATACPRCFYTFPEYY